MDFGLTATIGAFVLLVGFFALLVALIEVGAILADMQETNDNTDQPTDNS